MKQLFAIVVVAALAAVILLKSGLIGGGPRLSSVLPSEALPGAIITLAGSGLGDYPDDTHVLFNDIPVKPEEIFTDGLRVRIPPDARSGILAVAVGPEITNERFFAVKGSDKMPKDHPQIGGDQAAPRQQMPPGSEKNKDGGMGGAAHEFYASEHARPLIDFALPDSTGKLVKASDFKGRLIALNFWATWCEPCLEEVPSLERLTKRAKDYDLVVLAVSVDKSFDDIKKALPNTGLNVLLDSKAETANKYGTVKFPETWIIDKQGKIVARFIGARNWDSALFEQFFRTLAKGESIPGAQDVPEAEKR